MKRVMVVFFLLCFLFSSGFIHFQPGSVANQTNPDTVKSEPVAPDWVLPERPVTMVVSKLRQESPVRLTDVKIDIKVVGSMAVTTVDMIFFNPNARVLEGEFEFPLGEGQSISRFALDMNGKLREGVVVDKQKGREVFEDIIRSQVDPGLLEKTKGNNFRAKVYPLPAQGTRRVVIAYEQELKKEGDGYRFHLPVQYGMLDNFDLQATVFSSPRLPKTEETPWGKFAFTKTNDAFIATYSKKNFKKNGQLVFSIPQQTGQAVFVEKGKISGATCFYANVKHGIAPAQDKQPSVSAIDIYWDASASMAQRDLDRELDFLEAYLRQQGSVKVNLYSFNIFCNKVGSFNMNADYAKLKEILQNMPYDGATQYGTLNVKRSMSSSNANPILLFTDGVNTFGQADAELGKTPVIVVSSQLSADYSHLNYMASATGGFYINLMQQSTAEALATIRKPGIYFIAADYDADEIADFTPLLPQSINEEDVFGVTGKLKKHSARVTLHFGTGNKILSSKTIVLNKSMTQNYDNIVERMWAQKQITALDVRYKKNKTAIEELGKTFNIITRNTSLIVLDNVEDYVHYEITPPAELLAQYSRLMDAKKAADAYDSDKEVLENRVESVLAMFNNRKEWWNKTFPKDCRPEPKKKKNTSGDDEWIELRYTPVGVTNEEIMEDAFIASSVERNDARYEESEPEPAPRPAQANIQLKKWSPDTPYMNQLKKQSDKKLYLTYLSVKEEYKNAPSFYLDVASLFEERGLKKEALVVLSNLAEMEIEDYSLLRVLANRLRQLEYMDYAINCFEQVLELRPHEPQSYRDLGLAYASDGQYQKSVDALYEIVKRQWSSRFPEIEVIALEEMNRVIVEAGRKNVKLNLSGTDKRFVYEMPVDIRIVLNWDTDNTDMDLWVTDPCGEICIFNNPLTYTGGCMSRDFIGGYGPEVFQIKKALPGKYRIQANYYGSQQQTLVGATTIYLDIYTSYSSGKEKKETITLRLAESKETIDIGEIVFEKR